MKPIFTLLIVFSICLNLQAQTWNGNTSTDWNTPGNWSGNAVPLPSGNVTIPTAPAGNRFPAFAANTTIATLTMQAGAQLNVNGFSLTANNIDIRGVLNNSNAATDILITLGNGTTFVRNMTVNDNIQFVLNGTGTFYDNYLANSVNTYNGNATFTRNSTASVFIGFYGRNTYKGNVTISNTVASSLSAFEEGADVQGNLSFTTVGGTAEIGALDKNTTIGGTFNVNATVGSNIGIYRVTNLTNGGSISINDRSTVNLQRDTLLVSNLQISNLGAGSNLTNNRIVGNIVYSTAVGNGNTSFVHSNVVTGNATYTLNGTGVFYDSYLANTANSYSGNVSYTRNSTGATYIGFYSRNTYSGNVTMSNTVASVLDAFEAGADVQGNLSFTSVGGTAEIGDPSENTTIGGTLNVNASIGSNIGIYRVTNLTNGGSISINNRGIVNLQRDTLRVSTVQLSNVGSGSNITNNRIVGNIDFSTTSVNTGTIFVHSNVLTGNATYTLNGTGTFYDSYLANTANSYSGNVSYTRNANGPTYIGRDSRNTYSGNVAMSNTVASILEAFEAGADVQGNFSFTSVGGTAEIGDITKNTTIGGTLNVNATVGSNIGIYRVTNLTNGGSITINDRGIVNLQQDTIVVSSVQIGNVGSGSNFTNNRIIGNIDYSTTPSNNGTIFVRDNVVTGNAMYTLRGPGTFYDSYLANSGNTYSGNVSYTRTGTGPFYVAFYDTTFYGGNLQFNFNTGSTYDNRYIGLTGNTSSTISQDGNAPIQLYGLVLQKSGGASVTLLDSVRIVENVAFGSGNLLTSNQSELIYLDNATTVGANDLSKVIGPVVKIGNEAFTFPVGSATNLQSIGISAPATNTSRFRAQYFAANPHPTYDTSMRAPLARIGTCEYWQLLREIGATNVIVTLDYGGPCGCIDNPANLRIVRWTGALWQSLGNASLVGNSFDGKLSTTAGVTDYGIFGLGSTATYVPTFSIASNVANPVCLCRKVTFTATPGLAGCISSYQWRKNNLPVGTNSATYEDSTLNQGDIITCILTSGSTYAQPAQQTSSAINITTTDINTWVGTTSNNWHTPANWSCSSVPCSATKVVVGGSTPFPCNILSGNVRVVSLTGNTNSVFQVLTGATLEIRPL